jgi:hypothetical protein
MKRKMAFTDIETDTKRKKNNREKFSAVSVICYFLTSHSFGKTPHIILTGYHKNCLVSCF